MKRMVLAGLVVVVGCAIAAFSGQALAAETATKPAAAATPAPPEGPAMEFVQQFRGPADGPGRMTETSRVQFGGDISSLAFNGEYLYVSGKKGLAWFKRDLAAGKLTWAGELPLKDGCNVAVAGGRLYTVPAGAPGKTMFWYDLEAGTGKPTEKGSVECPPSFQIVVAPDQKDLYVKPAERQKDSDKVLWFHLGEDGAAVRAGDVKGKGIGAGQVWMPSLAITADGKFLYSADATSGAIACIERKPTGEIAYKKAIELKQPASEKPVNYTYPFVGVTPDGKWLYLSMLGYVANMNYNSLFKRDEQTGDLTLQQMVSEGYGKDPKQFYAKHMVMAFLPDSSGGFWANCERTVSAFKIDPATGQATGTSDFKDGRGTNPIRMAFDGKNGLLYAAGGPDLLVIKTAPAAGK